MADKVKSVDTFKQAMLGCIELEKTKRGLGKMFHAAVIDLLNENPGMTGEELSEVFLGTMTEVENTLRSELVEAFGDDFELKEAMPSWTQYKSDYKRAMLNVDRRDLIKCGGIADVKKKLNEVRAAMKEKAEGGNTDGTPADSKAGDTTTGHRVPASVQALIDEATTALEQMSEEDAVRIARGFKDKAWANMRNAKKKLQGVTGGKAESNVA